MTDTAGRATTGVIGALGLAEPGAESDILPHEQTLPKPKSDRLDLLRATRANLSPIWGLSMAPGVTATFDPTDDDPVADAYDDDGVRHQLWVLSDPDAVAAVGEAVARAPVVLADGHHRYETARAYQAECRAANGGRPGPHDLVMALVVELAEDQLTVGAIQRTVSGLPEGFDLVGALGEWFDVVRAGNADERTLGALADANSLALVTGGPGLPPAPPRRRPRAGGQRSRLQPHRLGALDPAAPRGDAPPQRGRGHGGAGRRRGTGGLPAPAGHGQADRRVGQRAPAHAAQDHVLQPKTPDRHGLPVPRPSLRSLPCTIR